MIERGLPEPSLSKAAEAKTRPVASLCVAVCLALIRFEAIRDLGGEKEKQKRMATRTRESNPRLASTWPIIVVFVVLTIVAGTAYTWRSGDEEKRVQREQALAEETARRIAPVEAALGRTLVAVDRQSAILAAIMEKLNVSVPLPDRVAPAVIHAPAMLMPKQAPRKPGRTCEHTHLEDRLWPMPSKVAAGGNGAIRVAGPDQFKFEFVSSGGDQGQVPYLISRAFERYRARVFASAPLTEAGPEGERSLRGVRVVVTGRFAREEQPTLDVDESYTLSLKPGEETATVKAETVWGALRGLETFHATVECFVGQCCSREAYEIEDKPRFQWRGLHVDSSRHFLPVANLLRVLDGMEMHKLNVFHWHLVDGQSFPLVSKAFPELSAKGAFSPDAVYTPDDVAAVIEYARERGIQVVPELDMPSHTASWGKAFPDLVLDCLNAFTERPCGPHKYAHRDGVNGFCVNKQALNPSKERLYEVVGGLVAELAQAFPSKFLHLGGDELLYSCWEGNRDVAQWAEQQKIAGGARGMLAYFSKRVSEFAKAANRSTVRWEEATDVLGSGWSFPADDVFQIWYGEQGRIAQALSGGYRVVNSLVGKWYLDFPRKWQDVYNYDPLEVVPSNLRPTKAHLMIGGEINTWSERVDADNLDSTIWPMGSVLAERTWSSRTPEINPFRLELQICRLKSVGIGATPLGPGHCDPPAPW